jgi:hypothetical protein
MKKVLVFILCALIGGNIKAQYRFTATMQTSTSNEFIQLPTFLLEAMVNTILDWETTARDKYYFAPQLVFPFYISNSAPVEFGDMRSGYARAFSAPWKHLGDYGIGISGAWDHYDSPLGFYVGLNYKSREVAFEDDDRNDRAHYISPEAGLRFKFGQQKGLFLEMGASYDYAFKYKGEMHNYNKDAINNGISLNLGIGHWNKYGYTQLNFKMPLYNFYNKDFTPDNGITFPFGGVDRAIGYVSLIFRNYSDPGEKGIYLGPGY